MYQIYTWETIILMKEIKEKLSGEIPCWIGRFSVSIGQFIPT